MSIFEIMAAFLPPFLIMLYGYSVNLLVFGKRNEWSVLKKWFSALITGSAIIIIPVSIMVLFFDQAIPTAFQLLSIFYSVLSFAVIINKRKKVKEDIYFVLKASKDIYNSSLSGKVAIICFFVLGLITVFRMAIGPVNDSNALMIDLPLSVNIAATGHLGPLASDYAVSLFYTWAMSLTNGMVLEPFRQIPTLLIMSYPLLCYALTKKLLTREIAIIALAISSVSPLLNYGIFLFAFSRDFLSIILGVASIVLFLERGRGALILSFISLGMAIFVKPPFGLPVMFILICLLLLSIKKFKINFPLALFLIGILLVGIIGNLSLFANLSSSIFAVAFAGFIIICIITVANRINFNSYIINRRVIIYVIIGLLPVFAYVARQVSLGGAPFGLEVPFIRQSASVSWWVDFNIIISAPQVSFATGTGPISNLCVAVPFFSPLLDPYSLIFKIIGLVVLFKKRSLALFLFLLSFFFYLSAMGSFPAGRYQILLSMFFFPVVALGILEFSKKTLLSERGRGILIAFITLLTALSWTGLYFWVSSISNFEPLGYLKNIISFIRITGPPYLDYSNPQAIGNLPFVFLVAVCLPLFVYLFVITSKRISVKHFSFMFRRLRFRRTINMILVGIFATTLMFPTIHYYWIASNGDFSSLNNSRANWYAYEKSLTKELGGQIPKNETMLTFAFPNAYYLTQNKINYIDLANGLSYSYPQRPLEDYSIIQDLIINNDLNHLKLVLSSLGIKYLLLPTELFYNYVVYENFNGYSPIIRLLNESYSMVKVHDYGYWELYELPTPIGLANGGFEDWLKEMPRFWNVSLGANGSISREVLTSGSGNFFVKLMTGDSYGVTLYQNGLRIQPTNLTISMYPVSENSAYEFLLRAGSTYYYFNILHGTASSHNGILTNSTIKVDDLNEWYTFTLPLTLFSTTDGIYYSGEWINDVGVGAYNPSTTVYFDDLHFT